MNEMDDKDLEARAEARLKRLRDPFADNQINRKPNPTKAQTEALKTDRNVGIKCSVCGQWHHKDATHLDYVGHAALTDRLLDVDPFWSWKPMALDPSGLPKFDGSNGMWIYLTVCGVTRLGYGHAGTKDGGDAIKEVIGDALRNGAMRFGCALDLWHKGDLHTGMDDDQAPDRLKTFLAGIAAASDDESLKDVYLAASAVCAKDKQAMAELVSAKVIKWRELHPEKGAK